MKKKNKPDSVFLFLMFWLFVCACILGASGCIFDDVIDEREAMAGCAIIGFCIVVYAIRCIFSVAEDLDATKPIDHETATILDLP